MTTGRECFEAWAGDHEWSDWTRPTLFASELFPSHGTIGRLVPDTADALEQAIRNDLRYRDGNNNRACVVVDMPGSRAIEIGAALSEHGYAPVVLFNGVASGRNPVVAHGDTLSALIRYAPSLRIPENPSPAFLLDSRRMGGTPDPGRYDNRWIAFPQDFPSGGLLRARGIKCCYLILEPNRVPDDLAHVLKRWQDAGIEMVDATNGWKPVTIQAPPLYKALYYRWSALLKLKPNSFGGFGAAIPIATRGYYGGYG
jgi:hypothetical protein